MPFLVSSPGVSVFRFELHSLFLTCLAGNSAKYLWEKDIGVIELRALHKQLKSYVLTAKVFAELLTPISPQKTINLTIHVLVISFIIVYIYTRIKLFIFILFRI